jgi:hypothetical protein
MTDYQALLNRVEEGTTTVDDADTLRDLIDEIDTLITALEEVTALNLNDDCGIILSEVESVESYTEGCA